MDDILEEMERAAELPDEEEEQQEAKQVKKKHLSKVPELGELLKCEMLNIIWVTG